MPNIKAAVKWVRQTEKRTKRNLDVKSRLKTLYKKAVQLHDGEFEKSVESQFDKAAQKGIIHPNKAARKKSRLVKAMKTAAAPAKTATKSSKSSAKRKASK
ncbi:MAG: 30S ribosomal protein S20 [Vulcanimicrobiaceae bacterium]